MPDENIIEIINVEMHRNQKYLKSILINNYFDREDYPKSAALVSFVLSTDYSCLTNIKCRRERTAINFYFYYFIIKL